MFLGLKVGYLVGFLPYELGGLGEVSASQSFGFLICNVGIRNSNPGLWTEWGHVSTLETEQDLVKSQEDPVG